MSFRHPLAISSNRLSSLSITCDTFSQFDVSYFTRISYTVNVPKIYFLLFHLLFLFTFFTDLRCIFPIRCHLFHSYHVGVGTLPRAIFRYRIFSNLAEIRKNKNNGLKFLFTFVLILLHIKSAFKKIWHLAQGRILDPCLGPYICISINPK